MEIINEKECPQCKGTTKTDPCDRCLSIEAFSSARCREDKSKKVSLHKVLEIIGKTRDNYPTSVFPEEGGSQDCLSAQMARITCDNIVKELIKEFR